VKASEKTAMTLVACLMGADDTPFTGILAAFAALPLRRAITP
jgi:hypothetical protein